MRVIEDNVGMFPYEKRCVPVCRVCGCKCLFRQELGVMWRLKKCPQCGHTLVWSTKDDYDIKTCAFRK